MNAKFWFCFSIIGAVIFVPMGAYFVHCGTKEATQILGGVTLLCGIGHGIMAYVRWRQIND